MPTDQRINTLRDTDFPAPLLDELHTDVLCFRQRFSDSPVYEEQAKFLEELAGMRTVHYLRPAEVNRMLRDKNPSYIGDAKFKLSPNGFVMGMDCTGSRTIEDLSPLERMPLTELRVIGPGIHDIRPLRGMLLQTLVLADTRVNDLTPLQGMPLENVSLVRSGKVEDISPIQWAKIRRLDLAGTGVRDYALLRLMPLESLSCSAHIDSLKPFVSHRLKKLEIDASKIQDLQPLEQMHSLESLSMVDTPVTNLIPLHNLPLKTLTLTPETIRAGLGALGSKPDLKMRRDENSAWVPASEFIRSVPGGR